MLSSVSFMPAADGPAEIEVVSVCKFITRSLLRHVSHMNRVMNTNSVIMERKTTQKTVAMMATALDSLLHPALNNEDKRDKKNPYSFDGINNVRSQLLKGSQEKSI